MASHGSSVLYGLPDDPVSFMLSRRLIAILTARERQVAELVSEGLTNREIADRLYISPRTVEYHIVSIFRKWFVRSRMQLAKVVYAFNAGLGTAEITKVIGGPERENVQEPYPDSPEKIEDLVGYALKPDPLTAKSLGDLEELLRALWAWAGYPSSRILASRSGHAFSHATISKLIHKKPGKPVLKLHYVVGFVHACGGGQDEQKRWVTAWRNIVGEPRGPLPGTE